MRKKHMDTQEIIARLEEHYPHAKPGLDYQNAYQLLIATILSAAMMLRYTFDLDKEADAIENAVKQVLIDGFRTCDIVSEGTTLVGCNEMGDKIVERI